MSVYEKMWSGELYNCADEELAAEQTRALELLADYNACRPSEKEKRTALLKQMFAGNRRTRPGILFPRPRHPLGRAGTFRQLRRPIKQTHQKG